MLINPKDLAKIQYHGEEGISQSCLNAIIRIIYCGERMDEVKLLTCETHFGTRHSFLISLCNRSVHIAIKSGFASGYSGVGSACLSIALQLLKLQISLIEEYNITSSIFNHIDDSCLLNSDIEEINSLIPVVPYRVHDYVYPAGSYLSSIDHADEYKDLLKQFPSVIPLRFVDFRVLDLAIKLKEEPDSSLVSAYRRLEGLIKKRTGIESDVIGAKLFTKAFRGDNAPLYWENVEPAEREGRAAMFEGIYMAFRNRRAHRELKLSLDEEIREFILVNELFLLESKAINRSRKQD